MSQNQHVRLIAQSLYPEDEVGQVSPHQNEVLLWALQQPPN